MTTKEDKKKIWDILMKEIGNPYGVAGVMGNLYAESSLNPLCMCGKNKSKWSSGQMYADSVSDGSYSREEFANDGIAFGLVQWYYHTRKEGLYDYAKGSYIGSIETQVGYLIKELSTKYKTVWNTLKNAKTVKEASDIFMLKYEKPANVSEAAKEKRCKWGHSYFDIYASEIAQRTVVTTADRVFVRLGNGKDYASALRISNKGTSFPWIATAENGWYAIKVDERVLWISNEFAEVK